MLMVNLMVIDRYGLSTVKDGEAALLRFRSKVALPDFIEALRSIDVARAFCRAVELSRALCLRLINSIAWPCIVLCFPYLFQSCRSLKIL